MIEEASEILEPAMSKISFPYDFTKQELMNKTRYKKSRLISKVWNLEKVKMNYRSNLCTVTKRLRKELKNNLEMTAAYEFLIASTYECLKAIKDYPELQELESTDQIRDYFFHTDLSGSGFSPLVVRQKGRMRGKTIYTDQPGMVAKEVSILTINIKAILEDLADNLS